MPDELTNLLPPERIRSLARDYYLRLSVVALWLLTALAVVASVLLVPSYLLLQGSEEEKRAYLATLNESLSSVDAEGLSARLAALAAQAKALTTLQGGESVSGLLRAVLLVPHPGIALSGLAYAPAAEGSVLLTGTAATRTALRNYQVALQDAAFAESASVPVSAYAKDANIPFTITVILRP